MRDNGLNVPSWDMQIYRIFRKDYFIDLLQTGENVLVHPSEWDDPFENFLLKCDVKGDDGEIYSLAGLYANWYGQCWTKKDESDPMWRIYSPDKNGVRVNTTIKRLFNSFYDLNDSAAVLKYFVSEIHYATREDIECLLGKISFSWAAAGGSGRTFAEALCIKRSEFEHEEEVRLLFHDVNGDQGQNKLVRTKLDVNKVCDSVMLDPRMCSTEVEASIQEFKQLGCQLPVMQSELYRFDKRVIHL